MNLKNLSDVHTTWNAQWIENDVNNLTILKIRHINDALHFARPIFGPAARALAQLPITIDKDGYLVANGDFIEPVGPAFWERRS